MPISALIPLTNHPQSENLRRHLNRIAPAYLALDSEGRAEFSKWAPVEYVDYLDNWTPWAVGDKIVYSEHYYQTMGEVGALIDLDPDADSPDGQRLVFLALIVSSYEKSQS